MSIRILSGTSVNATTVNSRDILIVPAGELFATQFDGLLPEAPSGAQVYTGVVVNVLGDFVSGQTAIDFVSTDDDFNDLAVNIGQDATVLAKDNGIVAAGNGSTITNEGQITSKFASIVQNNGSLNLFNSGSITSGAISSSFVTAVRINGDVGLNWIGNTGTITSRTGLAIGIDGGESTTLRNSGEIIADSEIAVEIVSTRVDAINSGEIMGGIALRGTFVDLLNSGAILGTVEIETESFVTLRNEGSISGGVTVNGGPLTFVNAGAIGDSVFLNDLPDTVVNAGSVLGRVELGAGADTYRAVGTGSVADGVEGGLGDDTLKGGLGEDLLMGEENSDLLMGGASDDVLIGGGGSDDLRGGTGDDLLQGNHGTDVIRGEAGADTLEGGSSNDTMSGGAGADLLLGGKGNDRLLGASGNDTLNGGTGRESMDGGSGEDVFVFSTVVESARGTQRDQIHGFDRADDLIDISALGDIAFSTTGAIGGGQGSVWADVVALGRHSLVRIDADGNGSIDSEVLVLGVTDLNHEDFLLG